MTSYPVELNITGWKVVVVGGGGVAVRKVATLVEAGAEVHVVSPSFAEELQRRTDIVRHVGLYEATVLDNARMVLACTDDRVLNARVATDARARGHLCSVADNAGQSDFLVPATFRQGALTIAVGTGGASPLLAAAVRDRLASQFGPQWGILTEELGRARAIVQEQIADPAIRREIFETLCADCSVELIARRGPRAWREWFDRIVAHRLERLRSG